jgi:hypothetical protein
MNPVSIELDGGLFPRSSQKNKKPAFIIHSGAAKEIESMA